MSRIRLLPEATANRIAAGEVIERPAAALKELVENALDAGATRIAVSLDHGGIDRMEVTDNGAGMDAEELALCVLRHATSKLADESLMGITTLGFRGEALPSIGAAARLEITSRTQDADSAHVISVEGGRVAAVAPAAGAAGTRVVVRDLFFATPARRKFLKSARIEADHAEAAVRRLAMAAPHVAFRLELDGRVVFEAPAQSQADRVAALLGGEAAAALRPVDETRNGYWVAGYVCSPAINRATPAAQTLVVNQRPVADPVLRTAVKVAYRDVIAPGRHAVVALYLDVPPDELDVNVHPAKAELRFRDPAAVRGLVIGAVRRALGVTTGQLATPAPSFAARARSGWPSRAYASAGAGWTFGPHGVPGGTAGGVIGGGPGGTADGVIGGWPGGTPGGVIGGGPGGTPDGMMDGVSGGASSGFHAGGALDLTARLASGGVAERVSQSEFAQGFAGGGAGALAEARLPFQAAPAARQIAALDPSPDHPLGAPVAQVLDTYIIAVAADGALVLVDQHAAHERLTHEAIRAQMLDGGVRAQPLLLPAVVDLPPADVRRLAARADDLAMLGLEIEEFGAGAVLVRALPAVLGAADAGPLLRDLADELAEMEEQTALSARLDAVIARMACHGSIRAGRKLGQAEMSALLRQMEATPRAATCSHGRPTVLKLSRADIEKMFGRR